MVNCIHGIDPDQTDPKGAVWSGFVLLVYAIISETIDYVRNFGAWNFRKFIVL